MGRERGREKRAHSDSRCRQIRSNPRRRFPTRPRTRSERGAGSRSWAHRRSRRRRSAILRAAAGLSRGGGRSVVGASDGEEGLDTVRRLVPRGHPRHLSARNRRLGSPGPAQGRSATASIPVIVVSMLDERRRGFALGATGVPRQAGGQGAVARCALPRSGHARAEQHGGSDRRRSACDRAGPRRTSRPRGGRCLVRPTVRKGSRLSGSDNPPPSCSTSSCQVWMASRSWSGREQNLTRSPAPWSS